MATSTDKSPAFRFYPRDFLVSEKQSDMSLQEAGAYIRLMCHCWLNDSLPDDLEAIARRAGATEAQMRKFWPVISQCFKKGDDGRWRHPRLDEERARQVAYRDRQAANGRKGGRPPKPNQKISDGLSEIAEIETKTDTLKNPLANAHANAIVVSGSSEGSLRETTDPPMDEWWLKLQELYPLHRVSRGARTQHEFVQQMLGFVDGPVAAWNVLVMNLDANILSHEWRVKGMIPRLEKYLADGLWRNILPADAPAAEQLSARTMRMMS